VLDRLAYDARFEGADVCGDIRQFRHAYQLAGRGRTFATSRSPLSEKSFERLLALCCRQVLDGVAQRGTRHS
jgi:hypothetical protein